MTKTLRSDLERLLRDYDRVLLADLTGPGYTAKWMRFLNSRAFQDYRKKIAVLITQGTPRINKHSFIEISEDAKQELKSLYYLYEFSNRFLLFSFEENYGGIWNYVSAGILSEDDAFRAILHENGVSNG